MKQSGEYMKRIGIMTLYYKNNNYGGIAQAYALTEYLRDNYYFAEIISYKRTPRKKKTLLENLKEKGFVDYVISHLDIFFKRVSLLPVEKILRKKTHHLLEQRKECFEKSREDIPHTKKVYEASDLKLLSDEYDIFLTGSDQVWKPGVIQGAYVWDFLPEDKKCLSYASSIATTIYPDWYSEYLKSNLEKFSWISVREKTAQRYLEQLTGRRIACVLDPTLLLDSSKWQSMISERIIKERYLFAYFLGESISQRKKTKQIAKQMGCKIVTLPHIDNKIRFSDICFGDYHLYQVSLKDFLNLIYFSECVVTDSFHAVVFSNIFMKKFWVFDRKTLEKKEKMGSRIDDFLSMLDESDRKLDNKMRIKKIDYNRKIDYNKVNLILKREKERSEKEFLKALNS